jgi:hypothetical protein
MATHTHGCHMISHQTVTGLVLGVISLRMCLVENEAISEEHIHPVQNPERVSWLDSHRVGVSTNEPNNNKSQRRAPARLQNRRQQRRPAIGLGPFARLVLADPFPPRRVLQLTYANNLSISSNGTAGLMGTAQTYRLNSLFDPDLTGTGTQPYGYDTLATIYQQYKVNRVRVSMDFLPGDPTYVGTVVAVLVPSAATLPTLAGANIDTFLDKPFTTFVPIGTNNTQPRRINFDLPIHMIDGLTRSQLANDLTNYSAFVTASPTSTPRLTFAFASSGTVGAFGIVVKTTITFYSELWDRFILAQS